MSIKIKVIKDISMLVKLRIDYLLDQNPKDSLGNLEDLKKNLGDYFEKSLKNNEFLAVAIDNEGTIYSVAFLSIAERPPRNSNEPSRIGTVYNVYTYPQYRKQGFATKVMERLCEEAGNLNLCAVDLYGSNEGKPLYEKLGFKIPYHTYMKKKITR